MTNSIEITIEIPSGELREKLIALLSLSDLDGFEEKDEQLICYYTLGQTFEKEITEILNQHHLSFSTSVLQPKNWNAEWEGSFSPVIVNNFCAIRAHFHSPVSGIQHDIVITPKMSFGTGHHATTFLMIQAMAKLDLKDKHVADFGTGTGVLAILAEKLGSSYIRATDMDEWSIENAKENFERNGCQKIKIERNDAFNSSEKFDIILANINRNVILQNLGSFDTALNKKGCLLLSGLLKADEYHMLSSCKAHNLFNTITLEKENWISMMFTRCT